MGKLVAVDGCTLQLVSGSGVITIENQPSSKVFADNKGVYFDEIKVTIKEFKGGGVVKGSSTVPGSIIGKATKCFIDNKPVVLEGDKSLSITIAGQNENDTSKGANTTTIVEVKVAGQSKVFAT